MLLQLALTDAWNLQQLLIGGGLMLSQQLQGGVPQDHEGLHLQLLRVGEPPGAQLFEELLIVSDWAVLAPATLDLGADGQHVSTSGAGDRPTPS